jgi:hypothetical protein
MSAHHSEETELKKLLCAILVCAICGCGLAGCGRKASNDGNEAPRSAVANPEVTMVPAEGGHGEEDQSQALANMPTLAPALPADDDDEYVDDDEDYVDDDEDDEDYYSIDALINGSTDAGTTEAGAQSSPDQTPTPMPGGNVIDPNMLSYTALNDPDMKLTFNYPSNWVNVPGIFTVCFREQVEPGEFPARVAISAKRLVHSPEGTVVTDELTEFVRVIRKQYDANTFQLGTLNAEDTFMGKQAYSNTYLAYSGETEVKGFVIGQSVGRVLYVFHFCASYDDYTTMERIMRYMLNSVQIIQEEKKE